MSGHGRTICTCGNCRCPGPHTDTIVNGCQKCGLNGRSDGGAEMAAKPLDGFAQRAAERRAEDLGVPLLRPKPKLPIHDSNPVVAICGACGIEVRKVMSMACRRADCPLSDGVSL